MSDGWIQPWKNPGAEQKPIELVTTVTANEWESNRLFFIWTSRAFADLFQYLDNLRL